MTTVNITTINDSDFYRLFAYQTMEDPPVPISIVGCTMEMKIRRRASDDAAVLRLGTDTGEIVLVDAVNGKFTVLITKENLLHIGIGLFEHSNVMTINGFRVNIWAGRLTNNPGAAR